MSKQRDREYGWQYTERCIEHHERFAVRGLYTLRGRLPPAARTAFRVS